ncbi:MAG: 5-(carboxyamino)imidazole ribonucleotide synthase, partial [Gemmatimonadaceae bacterium]|nr:5-(carboxyamino)imidazole ribonucleotide synthase [Gemmatimonadaceae bacterium]
FLARAVLHHVQHVRVHLYGKSPRPGRKMGHVGAVADTASDAVERVKEARARLTAPARVPAAAPRP